MKRNLISKKVIKWNKKIGAIQEVISCAKLTSSRLGKTTEFFAKHQKDLVKQFIEDLKEIENEQRKKGKAK